MTQLVIVACYLALLLGLGLVSSRLLRRASEDYMLASHSIGPVLLLLSLFGTTMTGFALVGSTGDSFKLGISVYAMLASASGIVHSLCFFVIGVRLWTFGRRHGYTTQIQFFRDRLDAPNIGLLLFPVLVAMVIIYLLIGIIPSGAVIAASGGLFSRERSASRSSADSRVSSDIRNWPGGDTRIWPTFSSMLFRFRAPQRACAEARWGAVSGGGSCRPEW
jgi:SSS family solute:Na+ symporter